jgi:prepilin-type N-terminal cleavage/methylation domain-containing protein
MLTGLRTTIRRWTGAGRRDAGFSVVELSVAMVISSLLLAIVVAALISMVRSYQKVQDTTLADDRGRVILDRLDHDLRQASAVNLPQMVGGSAYVEYETDVGAPGAAPMCTQWRLDGAAHVLAVRTWTLPAPATAPAWAPVATGVVNDLTTEAPFAVAAAGSLPGVTVQREQLTVQLRLSLPHGEALTRAAMTARNSSAATGAAVDADGDGVPDAPVCLTFGRS